MAPREQAIFDRNLREAETALSSAQNWVGLSVLFAAANVIWCLWGLL